MSQLQGRIPLVVDGGETPGGIASTVVDVTGAEPVILRPGLVTLEQINST
jgi:L-threonylcarbamoyladenylate synthase